ncbi:MAG: H-X9-DG-CTERM domain-containing protein [Armatimonadota bacterium]
MCSYAVNQYAMNKRLAKVKYPASKVAFCESNGNNYYRIRDPGSDWVPGNSAWRHNEGMNVGFFDGHSKWHKKPFPNPPTKDLYWRDSDVD